MNASLIQEIQKLHPDFLEEELQKGLKFFELKSFKAKEFILNAGEVSDQLFFAINSITRCSFLHEDGEEKTLWMKPEKQFITEFKSFVSGAPSTFNLQFYEDTDVYCISRENLQKLYSESIYWALLGIRLMETVHVTLIDVFVNLLANDATRNYQYIEYMFPRFIQVAPLKDIASMLQVSPVTLSRIRSGNQLKN